MQSVQARILTGVVDARNDFDAADRVKPHAFTEITINGDQLQFQIPACAVMEIKLGE